MQISGVGEEGRSYSSILRCGGIYDTDACARCKNGQSTIDYAPVLPYCDNWWTRASWIPGYWEFEVGYPNAYLQIDLGFSRKVWGAVTQGRFCWAVPS